MNNRLLGLIAVAVVVMVTAGLLRTAGVAAVDRTPPAAASLAPRTVWGEPDLQGIWTDPYQTPLGRPAQFAGLTGNGGEIFQD